MGNILQTGVKEGDHGGSGNQQPQVVSAVLDQVQAGVKGDDHGGCGSRKPQVVSAVLDLQAGVTENQLQPLGGDGGGHGFEATSMLKNCKTNSTVTYGGGSKTTDLRLSAEYLDDDPHHPSLPEGVQYVLKTLPVNARCIGDGDGFTAYVEKATDVSQLGSHVAKMVLSCDTNNEDILLQKYRIRMRGIDAPELQMQYGEESRNELAKLIAGKCIAIYVYGMDPYGRYVGDIYCDDIFIQEQMLKRGFAWHFETYDKRPELAQWEREAKEARRGLWSLDNPQKPWEWRRDQRNNTKKEIADDIQVEFQSQGNGNSETLSRLIKKDMETQDVAREWEKKLEKEAKDKVMELNKKLESAVAENMKINDQFKELKRKNKKAEDQAKVSEKEMENVVANNMKLNDQLQELKKNKKETEDRARDLKKKLETVAAVNVDLNGKLQGLKKKNKKAEDRAKESEKEMESVVAENIELSDQIQRLTKKNKNLARNSKKKLQNVAAVNMDLNDKLQELKKKNKEAEDRARQSKNELENVVFRNMELVGQLYFFEKKNKEAENRSRQSKKELENVVVENMELNYQLRELKRDNQEAEDRARDWKKKLQIEIWKLNEQLQKLKMDNKKAEDKAWDLKEKLENEKKAFSRLVKLGTPVLIVAVLSWL